VFQTDVVGIRRLEMGILSRQTINNHRFSPIFVLPKDGLKSLSRHFVGSRRSSKKLTDLVLVVNDADNVILDESYKLQHSEVETGEYVMLAVTDTGCGIYEETQNHIFEPFFTTKPAGKGTGLGLSTVYGIVKQSGGYVWVYTEVGLGTSFKVYLPRVGDRPLSAKSAMTDTEVGGCETILLVEDEEIVRKMVREILEEKGYRVLAAAGGDEALKIWQRHNLEIDLMLTDLVMPGMSGRVLGELMSQSRSDLLVLYMSGYTDDAIVRHGLLSDAVEFIQKPFTPTALAVKVRSVLDARGKKSC
jgi:two-component system, cell cycle sensor histidine kinase and response regulator CckA